MKNRGTFALLALFFAALVGLWLADFAQIPTRKQRDRMSQRILHELIDTKPDDLRKIEILGGKEPLVFERRPGNRWQMTSPLNVSANPSMVETLAYNLKELARRPDSAPLEGDPEQYGLARPEFTIKLWGEATSEPLASIDLGKTSLDRRYVRPGGTDTIEVVDAKGLDLLKLPTGRWRDLDLFRVPSFEVDSVTLTSPGKELKLQRSSGAGGAETWKITAPTHLLATESKVIGLIADLGSLKVLDETRFVANDVPEADMDRYGLKTPTLTIEVEAGRGNRRRDAQILHVGKPVEGKEGLVYARKDQQDDILAIDTRIVKDLKVDPNLYRSSKVADIQLNRVVRIALEAAEGSFEAVRTGNEWSIATPSPSKADRPAIQNFLRWLEHLETSNYPTAQSVPDPGFDKSSMVLKVWQAPTTSSPTSDSKGDLALNLRIGRRDGARKAIYARIEGDSTTLALPDTANDFIPRSSLTFRDRQVLAEPTDQIERIRLAGPIRQFTLNAPPLKLDPGGTTPLGWWLVEPVDAPADPPSIGQLLRLLAGLRAESLVFEKAENLEALGLKTPAMTLTWWSHRAFSMIPDRSRPEPSPGSITLDDRSLIVGGLVPGRGNIRYAKLSDRSTIFTLAPEVLALLDLEWRHHDVLSFNPKQVRKVELHWPDRSITLEPIQEGKLRRWSIGATVDAPGFDPETVVALIQGASKLTTTRYTQHLGDFPEVRGLTPPRLSITFEMDDGSLPRTIKVGAPAVRGQVFASTEKEAKGAIFLVPEAAFTAWLRPPRQTGDLPDDVFIP